MFGGMAGRPETIAAIASKRSYRLAADSSPLSADKTIPPPCNHPLRSQKLSSGAIATHAMQDHAMTIDTPDRILRINTVLERTGLSRSTLYRKIQQGTFPRQIAISTRCAGWRASAVAEWMKNPMFYSVEDYPER